MKKLITILLAVFLLTGCVQMNPEQTTAPSTGTTEESMATTVKPAFESSSEPIETTDILPQYPPVIIPRRFVMEDVAFFNALLSPAFLEEGNGAINYYNRILQSEFMNPQAADLSCIFQEQDGDESQALTEAEKAFLRSNSMEPSNQVQRISGQKMDTVLFQILGLNLSQMLGIGMERMVYFPETDCYYYVKTHSNPPDIHILGGRWLHSKKAEIYYTLTDYSYTATLEKTDSGFHFLSIESLPYGTTFPEDLIIAPEPTQPQQTEPIPAFTPALWLTEPEYVPYEEYFSSERSLSESSGIGWLVTNSGKDVWYWVNSTDFTIRSSAREDAFSIPNGEKWKDYGLIHADGRCAWLISDTRLVMVEMETGEIMHQVQISCKSRLDGVLTDNAVYYFADHSGGQFHIFRVYLPELKVDHLRRITAPETCLSPPEGAGIPEVNSLTWAFVNPRILAAMEEAHKDPDSALRFEGCGNLWESQYPYADVKPEHLKYGIYCIQNALGEAAYVRYIYNCAEDTFTAANGIICDCEYGTGQPHDHGDPVAYDIAQPILAKEAWMPIPGMELRGQITAENIPEDPAAYRFLSFVNRPDNLPYLVEDGVYTQLHTESAKSGYIFNLTEDEGQGVFYISEDNRLLQLSYDGSICNTLYASSEEITDVAYLEGYFYVLEGENILQLDVPNGKYRVLVHQKDCKMLESVSMPDGRFLYIRAMKGLSFTHYVYNPATDAIEPWYAVAL